MYKRIKLITSVNYRGFSTYYLYYKESKILIPVEIDKGFNFPSSQDSMKRIILALGSTIKYIKIYKSDNGTFYTYLSLETNGKKLDVSVSFLDAIDLALKAKAPIYAKEEIIKKHGLQITKEIVQKALAIN